MDYIIHVSRAQSKQKGDESRKPIVRESQKSIVNYKGKMAIKGMQKKQVRSIVNHNGKRVGMGYSESANKMHS